MKFSHDLEIQGEYKLTIKELELFKNIKYLVYELKMGDKSSSVKFVLPPGDMCIEEFITEYEIPAVSELIYRLRNQED